MVADNNLCMIHSLKCDRLKVIRFESISVNSDINLCLLESSPPHQIVSYLLDLPEKDEEEVERAQINNFDTLWGETGGRPHCN